MSWRYSSSYWGYPSPYWSYWSYPSYSTLTSYSYACTIESPSESPSENSKQSMKQAPETTSEKMICKDDQEFHLFARGKPRKNRTDQLFQPKRDKSAPGRIVKRLTSRTNRRNHVKGILDYDRSIGNLTKRGLFGNSNSNKSHVTMICQYMIGNLSRSNQ